MRASLWSDEVTAKRKAAHLALILLIWASVLAGTVLAPPTARADDTTCGVAGAPAFASWGFLTGGSYDNVVVPEGGGCFIQFADIKGSVKALPDSHLIMLASEVGGNVIGDKADLVQVTSGLTGPPFVVVDSEVHGDIQIKEGGPNTATLHQEVMICGVELTNGNILVEKMTIAQGLLVTGGFCEGGNNVINGNVTIQENNITAGAPPGSGLSVEFNNQIGNGNLHVFKNYGPGGKSVTGNFVSNNGEIQCRDNTGPFIGGPNAGRTPNGSNQCFSAP